MALITENCPLVALIKSCCVSRKVLVTEAGERERGVSCSWSFDLSAGPAGPTSGQAVSRAQWPQVTGTEAYQLFSAFVRGCVPSLGGVVPHCCCMSKALTKSKGLHFVGDDIECCKGERPVFCGCRSETVLQLYTQIHFLKNEETFQLLSVLQCCPGLVRSSEI